MWRLNEGSVWGGGRGDSGGEGYMCGGMERGRGNGDDLMLGVRL